MPRIAQITSTGRYIPERVLTNDDLNQMLGENVGDWLVANVGIEERHIMAEDETTASMLICWLMLSQLRRAKSSSGSSTR